MIIGLSSCVLVLLWIEVRTRLLACQVWMQRLRQMEMVTTSNNAHVVIVNAEEVQADRALPVLRLFVQLSALVFARTADMGICWHAHSCLLLCLPKRMGTLIHPPVGSIISALVTDFQRFPAGQFAISFSIPMPDEAIVVPHA